MSAQCTDKRVNQVTPLLFAEADTPQKMADLPDEKLEKLIYSCGFYKNKARFIKEMSRDLIERFGGQVPDNLEQLRTLSGVGRKTANVVYAVGFGGQAIAVDTHVFRVANRLGLAHAKKRARHRKTALPSNRQRAVVGQSPLLAFARKICMQVAASRLRPLQAESSVRIFSIGRFRKIQGEKLNCLRIR